MFLNHARKRVSEWLNEDRTLAPQPSHCPDCGGLLSAVRGDHSRWHWRHVAAARSPDCRMGGESEWHLGMKDHFAAHGFELEVCQEISGNSYRFDAAWCAAANDPRHYIVEFVGSLSPAYTRKAKDLHREGVSEAVAWVFSSKNFASERRSQCSRGGMRNLVKPNAYDVVAELSSLGQAVYIDYSVGFVHWRDNVWYPVRDRRWADLIARWAK